MMHVNGMVWYGGIGWNQIQFNLSDFTRRAYGTNYIETLRVQIHANCRIRRYPFASLFMLLLCVNGNAI
jgi:hypothetical protein